VSGELAGFCPFRDVLSIVVKITTLRIGLIKIKNIKQKRRQICHVKLS